MRNILYSKNDVEIYTQYGDVILFTPHLMVFKEDTPENRIPMPLQPRLSTPRGR